MDTPLQTNSNTAVSWQEIAALDIDPWRLERQRIISLTRRHSGAAIFDIMRTKVLQDARTKGWRTLGISAPTEKCGKTTVAANLAISLARHEKLKIALIDLELRRPNLARIFGHSGRYATEDFLRGRCQAEDYLVRLGDNLAIGTSPPSASHVSELLHSADTAAVLGTLRAELGADLVLYNLPALLEGDDCLGLLPLVEASLLVVGAEQSTIDDIDVCERQMRDRTHLLGVVLNKCRYPTGKNSNFQA
ncbi:CpsD/CapB family tyrosine-protein kinase [Devosia sp. A449]